MKLELKAYKLTFPSCHQKLFSSDIWTNPDKYDIIYGKNGKEAINKYCNGCYEPFFSVKKDARIRRFKEADLYSQDRSPLLTELSENEIGHLTHSLGIEIGDRFKGDFYRNYSLYYSKNEEFDKLIELGLFETYEKRGSHVYRVTEKGKDAAKTLLLITY